MKIEINNSERLEIIKHVNREIRKGGTVKRFEMLYELKDKLKVYVANAPPHNR